MTSNQPPAGGNDQRPEIGDQNVERLLHVAYDPEVPDPAFVRGVRHRMLSAASERSSKRREGGPVRTASAFVRDRVLRLPVRKALAWTAAAMVLVGLGYLISSALRQGASERRGGRWAFPGQRLAPLDQRAAVPSWDLAGKGRLTARARPQARPVEPVVVGTWLETKAGQRRRVSLPDGSVAYLNQATRLAVESRRRLRLARGEVFLEVAPREPGGGRHAPFVVSTPGREVTALGTKFAVRVDSGGTNVLVTQGKVQVSGYAGLIHAGRQLSCGRDPVQDKATAIPRASHVLAWMKDLVAAAASPLVPDSKHAGGALIAVDPFGQEAKLSLRRHHVDVHIEDGFARTTIDQTYFNHMHRRLEGTFYFPLPADASISRLAMYVNGQLMEGGMAERAHARYVFEDIMHTRKDPALLEWVDGSTFKMRVFPLEPRREKRIILSYAQRLSTLYGQTEYRFPGGHSMELVDEWLFQARVLGGAGMSWSSDAHQLQADKTEADLLLRTKRAKIMPREDVVLRLEEQDPAVLATAFERFSLAEHEGHRYLMLRYRPEMEVAAEAQPERRDWVFLFEASGDRDPLLARVQVDVIEKLLEQAEGADQFAVLAAGTHVRAWTESFQPVTPENVAAAVKFLEKAHLVGALDLEGALAAAKPLLAEAENGHLVHLGTGIAVLGERRTDRLVELIPEAARYVGVGVGKRWSRGFMKEAAAQTGGYFTQINPDENVPWRAFELLSTLNTPRLLNVKVAGEPTEGQFLCFADSLADGEELCAVARFEKGASLPEAVAITGTLDGKDYSQRLLVHNVAEGADYLPRFWAKLEIDRLLAADADANRDKIVALSKAMYVMSPFTSLLVLENEQMYTQYKVDRGRKDHWALYPAPKKIKVVYETDPARPGQVPAATDSQEAARRPSAEQVLGTILVRIPPPFLTWPSYSSYYGGQTLTAWQLCTGAYALPYETGILSDRSGGRFGSSGRTRGGGRWVGPALGWETSGLLGSKEMPGGGLQEILGSLGPRGEPGPAPRKLSEMIADGEVARKRSARRAFQDRISDWTEFSAGDLERSNRFLLADQHSSLRFDWGLVSARTALPRPAAQPAPLSRTWNGGRKYNLYLGKPYDGRWPVAATPLIVDYDGDWPWRTAEELEPRLRSGYGRNVLYRRANFTGDYRVFSDLLSYAPGMDTSWADVLAVLEEEASVPKEAAPGEIDPKARALIEKARRMGWAAVTIPNGGGEAAVTVTFDGSGRYACRRTTWAGLDERVVCDGKTLWHLYEELGVGATRRVSRFHRAEFAALVPWMLRPAEELARGADLRHVAGRTVALCPIGAEKATDADGKPVRYARLELDFAADGRLAERRLLEMPSGKLLYRQRCAADGTVTWLDGKDKVLATWKMKLLRAVPAPNLEPDTQGLVILPLPLRSRQYVLQARKLPGNIDSRYGSMSAADALALLAADLNVSSYTAQRLIGQRFFNRGDRRIGFYTLLLTSNRQWNVGSDTQVGNNVRIRFDPVKDHPGSPLAEYVAQQAELFHGQNYEKLAPIGDPRDGFVQRLAGLRYLYFRWSRGRANQGTMAQRNAEHDRALEYVRKCGSSLFGWAILTTVQNYGGDRAFHRAVAEAARQFQDIDALSYAARYEAARALHRAGDRTQALELFAKLYDDTFQQGVIPKIDHSFRQAFQSGPDGANRWAELMRGTCAALIAKDARAAAVVLAWQCHSLGDQPLAEELLSAAMTGADKHQRVHVRLTAIEFLAQTNRWARADGLIEPLLADEKLAGHGSLWRLGALLAERRGRLASSLRRLEKAVAIEYARLPDMVNLQAVRSDYSALLGRYHQLAQAIATLETEPPEHFLAQIIGAADRWRALDADDTAACQSAAAILQALGARELAWEYLTTPLAMRPNEAAPWRSLAQALRRQGEYDLAQRAYASAFEAESTNAQILWDRAQLLQQLERTEEAQRLFRQIAEGTWPRQFNWIRSQARRYLGMQ